MTEPGWRERLLIAYARRFPVDRGKLRVINALSRAGRGDAGEMRTALLEHGGFRMDCDLRDQLQRQFYFFGTYFLEKTILQCWAGLASRADVVFDVGANAGIFSLAALAARPAATVHAFEPTPEIAAHLRRTASANGLAGLHVHQVAVSDRSGTGSLRRWRGADDSNSGMNYVVHGGAAEGEQATTVTLDEFCAQRDIRRIDLLKLDIQGSEHLALAGARRLLSSGGIPIVFTELNWGAPGQGGSPAEETIELLAGAGYRFARPARVLRWREEGRWMRALTDVVAAR